MVKVRISFLKSLYTTPPRSPNPSHTPPHLIPLQSHSTQNPKYPSTISPTPNRFSSFQPPKFTQSPNLYLGSITFPLYNIQIPRTLTSRPFSSFFGSSGEPNKPPQDSNTSLPNGDEWVDHLKKVWHSAGDAAAYTGQKVQEASDQVTPYVHHLFEKYPYLQTAVIPVGWTLIGTMLAWMVMPRVLRKLHKYSTQGTAALLSGSLGMEQISYEKSFWAALEDPVRYLVTFMAFSQLALLAPATIAPHYITQTWRGAVILSFVWFLHRWKGSIFARALVNQSLVGAERENLLLLDKLSSVGLFVIGLMASAEACGVATQSVLTVGGIGGAAAAFASKDILGNVLSGLSMQFSKPFSLGDTIKVGSIEGQVVEMGLTTTSLINSEKFPLTVPNSLFSSQVIVNKSRAQWHGLLTTIPLRIANLEKIPQISEDIKSMLKSNTQVFVEKEAPYCFVARIENSYAELTIGCNLKKMSKEELYSTRQDILLQASQVIKHHGVELGSTQYPS